MGYGVLLDEDVNGEELQEGTPPGRRCRNLVDEAVPRSALDAAAEVCLCMGKVHRSMPSRAMKPG